MYRQRYAIRFFRWWASALALTDAPECSLLVQMPARPRSQGRATSASFDRQT